ncbi:MULTISPECIES: hypothetical protein [unclassified Microbacterium]|uniref:hypothetical protein n=1 Tax=unclassified Microbacterium TaxID=2609290 RepID=UPI003015C9F2
MFASQRTESEWVLAGSPYCEHPQFRPDRGSFGRDELDEYCTVCGLIRLQGTDVRMPPRGIR